MDTHLRCWDTIYNSRQNRIMVDQGTQFWKSELLMYIDNRFNAQVEANLTEAHASLGI